MAAIRAANSEAHMANKNKGGRNTKKAGKSLKEKRAAKRAKS